MPPAKKKAAARREARFSSATPVKPHRSHYIPLAEDDVPPHRHVFWAHQNPEDDIGGCFHCHDSERCACCFPPPPDISANIAKPWAQATVLVNRTRIQEVRERFEHRLRCLDHNARVYSNVLGQLSTADAVAKKGKE
jgi:hypothetical protein